MREKHKDHKHKNKSNFHTDKNPRQSRSSRFRKDGSGGRDKSRRDSEERGRRSFGDGRRSKNFSTRQGRREFHDKDKDKDKSSRRLPHVFSRTQTDYIQLTKTKLEAWREEARQLQETPPGSNIVLDPWQQQALDSLNQGLNVVVDAPTTAGKTRIVEMFFREHLSDPNFKAIYTTPVKSLSNDKLYEFRRKFGEENVGIATGDIKDNLGAPIVIATLECYRNSLLGIDENISRNLVIFDEYHYLQDAGRGSGWEQAIILSPENTQLLLLSASVGNPEDFVDWLSRIKTKEVKLIQTTYRPVPLVDLIYSYKDSSWVEASTLDFKPDDFQGVACPGCDYDNIVSVFPSIISSGLYPTIVYCGRRKQCMQFAKDIVLNIEPMEESRIQHMSKRLEELDSSLGFSSFIDKYMMEDIIQYGVAYHHSGLAFSVKLLIENLLKEGLLRFCVSTMGLSLGVDFSVRSALIVDMSRPDERGFIKYDSGEVLQMLGRAGRRGKDPVGYSLWWGVQPYCYLKPTSRVEVSSQFKTDITTFLGLVGKGIGLGEIEKILTKSFSMYDKEDAKIDFITRERVSSQLGEDIPCFTPVKEYQKYMRAKKSAKSRMICSRCELRSKCFSFLNQAFSSSAFVGLHFHLHEIGALDREEKLTEFGSLARYFPQSGGLIIAESIAKGKFSIETFGSFINLMGAFSLPYYKSPSYFADKNPNSLYGGYGLPQIEDMLERFYPIKLFSELYDDKSGFYMFREFNPAGARIIQDWFMGEDFKVLELKYTNDTFGTGDLMSLIYRVASYVQSLAQIKLGEISEMATLNRSILLRDPLDKNII